MSDSRFEVAQQDLLDEFSQITIANGYRTDISDVIKAIRSFDQIKQNEIGIVIPTGTIDAIDGIATGFDIVKDVVVQGVVFSDTVTTKDQTKLNTALAGLEQDMVRVMANIVTKYIANNPTRWNILPQKAGDRMKMCEFASGVDFGQQPNQGVVLIMFKIQLRALDGTFL